MCSKWPNQILNCMQVICKLFVCSMPGEWFEPWPEKRLKEIFFAVLLDSCLSYLHVPLCEKDLMYHPLLTGLWSLIDFSTLSHDSVIPQSWNLLLSCPGLELPSVHHCPVTSSRSLLVLSLDCTVLPLLWFVWILFKIVGWLLGLSMFWIYWVSKNRRAPDLIDERWLNFCCCHHSDNSSIVVVLPKWRASIALALVPTEPIFKWTPPRGTNFLRTLLGNRDMLVSVMYRIWINTILLKDWC